ncbi:retrovirus-related Pol polyprotein from transposon TNT 1-94 [Trichonephila clavipes]|nr:retrovirus-related Pol polyprotein from transposon TNT 1-94 [Trichonephila clavipes]
MKKTTPYNSKSNGKAERANRVLLERARSLLYESKLPLKFWAEAINCSTQVSNVTPRKGKEKIPLEIWTGNKPKLNYVKKFECVAYFHVTKVLRNKFEVPEEDVELC